MRSTFMAKVGRIAIVSTLTLLLGTSPLWAASQRPLRIAVVGAGAAGLTAAYELTALGHEVVVFEKEKRVGGKVSSVPVGDIALEFGAVLVTEDNYPITLGYAERFGISSVPTPVGFTLLDESGNRIALQDFLQARYSATEIGAAEKNYAAMLDRFAAFIDAPGLVSVPDDLSLPFSEFAERYGIGLVEDWMKALLTGFGYGYSETVPAAYYVKFLSFLVKLGPSGLEAGSGRIFPGGFQSVLNALAATLDVRLDSEVTHIQRPGFGCPTCQVRITVNGTEQHWFDAVVIATPLNIVPRFLDVTPFEEWLFTRMQSVRYFVTLFAALGGGEEILYFRENANPSRINHVGALASPYDFGSIALGNAYQVVEPKASPQEIQTLLEEDLRSAGGRYLLSLGQKEWPNYFPHVGPLALKLGFYDVIDRMQGNRGTYFVGSSLTFETVEHAARQAKSVILEHFGDPATGGRKAIGRCSAPPG